MMKRKALTRICALCSVFMMSSFGACDVSGLLNQFGGSSTAGDSLQVESPVTSETPEESENPSSEAPETSDAPSSEVPESSENPETSETPETPENPTPDNPSSSKYELSVTTTGEVFPYIENVKNYLLAGEGAKVGDYHQAVSSQWAPVEIKWNWRGSRQDKFVVEYATKADYSDAFTVEAGGSKRSVEVYNLYKSTTYYVRITALNSKGETLKTAEGSFYTTNLGPRFMRVDDVRNMRDLGGYVTNDGKALVQGIAYRGGGLVRDTRGGQTNEITAEGITYMSEVMGIKTEIDFRTAEESGITLEQGSLIPGASLHYITINSYGETFNYDDEYLEFFTMLADEDNYPVYMHCTGGADRTGSAVYLLHTMLGVSELECLQGYELTSFSSYGLRDTQEGYKKYFDPFMTKLNSYEGNTKQEKVETWMRSIGVTQSQIDKIKSIFYGEISVNLVPGTGKSAETPVAQRKTVAKRYGEMIAAWTVQKKED